MSLSTVTIVYINTVKTALIELVKGKYIVRRTLMYSFLLSVFMNVSMSSCTQPDTIVPQSEVDSPQAREASSTISVDDFERNKIANFWAPTLFVPTNLNLSTEQARTGKQSARFSWSPKQYDGTNNSCHSELAADMSSKQDVERWYGFSMFLPASTMANDDQIAYLMQWHDQPDPGYEGTVPPINIELKDNKLVFIYRASNKSIVKPMQFPTSQKNFDLGTATYDRWVDYVVHVKWDPTGNRGVVQLWQNGVLKVNEQNVSVGYPNCQFFWKLGLYCWTGKSSHSERTMYYDDVRIGGPNADYDAVKPGRSNGSAK